MRAMHRNRPCERYRRLMERSFQDLEDVTGSYRVSDSGSHSQAARDSICFQRHHPENHVVSANLRCYNTEVEARP